MTKESGVQLGLLAAACLIAAGGAARSPEPVDRGQALEVLAEAGRSGRDVAAVLGSRRIPGAVLRSPDPVPELAARLRGAP